MLPISTQVLLSELDGVKSIVEKWMESLARGIPVVDNPHSSPEQLEKFLREMCGELGVCAAKCEGIRDIMGEILG